MRSAARVTMATWLSTTATKRRCSLILFFLFIIGPLARALLFFLVFRVLWFYQFLEGDTESLESVTDSIPTRILFTSFFRVHNSRE